ARARGAARGRARRRRLRVAALLAHHRAADEAGDPRRAAVPHAGRVPDLRLRLHHLQRPQPEARDGLDPRVQPVAQPAQPRPRLGGVGADLPVGRPDRVPVPEGLRNVACPATRGDVMRAQPSKIAGWTSANFIVVLFALFPVFWIAMLSLKSPSTISDGRLIPKTWSF